MLACEQWFLFTLRSVKLRAKMLGIVASVCWHAVLCKRMQQLRTMLGPTLLREASAITEQCWELLAFKSLTSFKLCATT